MNEYQPMLAEKAAVPFDDPRFLWETKYDGARCLAYVQAQALGTDKVRLLARSNADHTATFPELQEIGRAHV